MKFSEAMALLEQGKKVRCKSWSENGYCCKSEYGNLEVPNTTYTDMFHVDDTWEEYVEPKKKRIVKMWPAVIGADSNSYYLTDNLYESLEVAKEKNESVVRLATEYPAIEVEVEDV